MTANSKYCRCFEKNHNWVLFIWPVYIFSAVISVITTTVFKRAFFPLDWARWHILIPSPSEDDGPLCAREQTQVKPFPCLHPGTAVLQRARRANTGWWSERVYLWDEAWLNFAPKKGVQSPSAPGSSSNPTENKGNQRKEKISWGNCSLLPSDLRRTGLVSLNQMSINDNLKRQKLFTTKGWCRNHNNNQERYFTSIIRLLLKGWVFWHLFPYIQHGLKMLPEFVLQFFYTTPQLPFTSTGSPPKRKAAAPTI